MENKHTAVITGGSKGIGLATARKFAELGWNIAICARGQKSLDIAKETLLGDGASHVLAVSVDLTKSSEIYDFASKVLDKLGTPTVLVNNAGTYTPGQIHNEDDKVFEIMMSTNLNSTYYMCKAFLPSMTEAKAGHVINVCSTASIMPYVNGGSYCISKFAQYGLTKVLREEMKEYGVRVTAILPGATRTESWDGTDLPNERFIPPLSVADTIFHAYRLPDHVDIEEIIVRPFEGDIT